MVGPPGTRSGRQAAAFSGTGRKRRAGIKGGKGGYLFSTLRRAGGSVAEAGRLRVIRQDAPGLPLAALAVFDPKAVHPNTTVALEILAQQVRVDGPSLRHG